MSAARALIITPASAHTPQSAAQPRATHEDRRATLQPAPEHRWLVCLHARHRWTTLDSLSVLGRRYIVFGAISERAKLGWWPDAPLDARDHACAAAARHLPLSPTG